jgi:hypothetical protein
MAGFSFMETSSTKREPVQRFGDNQADKKYWGQNFNIGSAVPWGW